MRELNRHGFAELIIERVNRGTPLLGVCVGMQMLFEESTEFGHTKGLGLLKGSVRRFDNHLVVPHVGWNQVTQQEHSLFEKIPHESFFYFVHSYYCEPVADAMSIGKTEYGAQFASVVAEKNICGVQFHPEKSQHVGLQLLKNFSTQ
jgi:glutamine amidotransferase